MWRLDRNVHWDFKGSLQRVGNFGIPYELSNLEFAVNELVPMRFHSDYFEIRNLHSLKNLKSQYKSNNH